MIHVYAFSKTISTADDLARSRWGDNSNWKLHIIKQITAYCEKMGYTQKRKDDWIKTALSPAKGNPVEGLINHNRLIVMCPNCGAGGAINYTGDFYCLCCYMVHNEGLPSPIILPKKIKWIVKQLEKREIKLRNWLPTETLADIKKENKDGLNNA